MRYISCHATLVNVSKSTHHIQTFLSQPNVFIIIHCENAWLWSIDSLTALRLRLKLFHVQWPLLYMYLRLNFSDRHCQSNITYMYQNDSCFVRDICKCIYWHISVYNVFVGAPYATRQAEVEFLFLKLEFEHMEILKITKV